MKPYIKPISELLEFPELMQSPETLPGLNSGIDTNAAPMRMGNGQKSSILYI